MTLFELQWRILLSASDDYESFDHIRQFVEREANEDIALHDFRTALDALLRQNLVSVFRYNDHTFEYEMIGSQAISEKMWFYVSIEGARVIDLVRADSKV